MEAVVSKPTRLALAKDSKEFIERFNKHNPTKEFMRTCEVARKLFKKEGKDDNV